MSEVEGEWAELLHESALEAATAQASAKPASVPEPAVTLPPKNGSREGCMGAISTREILRVLPQPIFLCDTASR